MTQLIDMLNDPGTIGAEDHANVELEIKCNSILARLLELSEDKVLIDILLVHTICPAGLCMTEASFIIENLIHHQTDG